MALLTGSPAIDTGTSNGAPTTDQRGFGRVGAVDIGAFESQGSTLVVNTAVDGFGSGPAQLSLRQALNLANTQTTADTISFDPVVFGSPRTINLDGTELLLSDPATTTITGPGASLLTVTGGNASRVFEVAAGASASISGLTITGGNASDGGGLLNSGTLSLSATNVVGNTASQGGGGVYTARDGTSTLTDCTISGNSAAVGGGVESYDATTGLNRCTISGNQANATGGGLISFGSQFTLTECTISGNSSKAGGGLYTHFGSLSMSRTTVSGNTANYGGGVCTSNTAVDLESSTLSGNVASTKGGGLYSYYCAATLTDCTISGNSSAGSGGGVYLNLYGARVTGCTISGNHAATGGGLVNKKANSLLTDTIVAGQASGGDILELDGTDSGSNNLIGDGTGESGLVNGVNGNLVGTTASSIDPLLAPLGDYGGPTLTMPLLPGSPAIDAGTATGAPTTDQRGLGRVGAVDIGAFESQGFVLTPLAGSSPQSALIGTAFTNPLTVVVSANNPVEPVNGGRVTFAANPVGGSSASLSAATATISGGQAGVTAAANTKAGHYTVTASIAGASAATFNLTNTLQLTQLAIGFGVKSFVVSPSLTRDLPWTDVSTIQLTFNGDPSNLTLSDFSLTGTRFGNYLAGASLSSNASTQTVTISLAASAVIGSTGWTAVVGKNGDHVSLGFEGSSQSFNVLPGDVTGDGVVDAKDLLAVRNQVQAGTYSIWADVDGSGVVDLTDYTNVRKRIGGQLVVPQSKVQLTRPGRGPQGPRKRRRH